MARLPRYFVPNQPMHVILRGNNRTIIFKNEADYSFYLECIADAANTHGADIHAYVLMTNHVHFLITPHYEDSLPKTLQSVGRRYVQYFNYTYNRTGTLWEGRYRATLIDSEHYLLICSRYIELNPVRARMVSHPREYHWSSYGYNAEGKENELISEHRLYRALGKTNKDRQIAYKALFKTHVDETEIHKIRESTNKGWVLGSERFKRKAEEVSGRRATPLPKGRPKKLPDQ